LLHVLSPKFISVRARPLGKTESRSGRLILFLVIGAVFWLFVFGMFYRLLKYFHGIPEIGALLAAKLLGLMFVSLFGILILSNVVTALSSFFLAKDLDLLVAAPVDWLRLYGAKLLETTAHSDPPERQFARFFLRPDRARQCEAADRPRTHCGPLQ